MPIAELNHQGIYFEDSGGSGPAIILAHGFLMDSRMFDAQVQALAPAFRVIRWDARGFGRTRWDGKPFDLYDSAADCIALLDHLGIRQAVVGGMSQGGYCALRVALRYPDRVRALVLMSTRGTIDEPEVRAGYLQTRDLWGTPGATENIIQFLAGGIIGDSRFHSPWLDRWRQTPKDHFVAAMNNLIDRDDIRPRLGDIHCPAIVFHGTDDTGIPPSEGELLHKSLPGSTRLVLVPGAAHAANMTHPDAVNPPLVEFLRAHA
ncbi:MAG TPA: alpha/beta fold hydrolase [Archangium sp.]|uniref:alpha/beta fold hydrolase n=1 Tax=Archangium sp. TaxID=1872627 RepID=UPI002E32A63F|nr:alpha/beta fold hydrolase [Archangium sp.]HEX5747611.1 alpha/beta fold hydrolase [Archangium sp.]